jgi:hypothetical protein
MSSANREARQIYEHNSMNHLGTTSNIGLIIWADFYIFIYTHYLMCREVMGAGYRHSWGRGWSKTLWMKLARLWPHSSVLFFFWFGQSWHLQSHYTSYLSWYYRMPAFAVSTPRISWDHNSQALREGLMRIHPICCGKPQLSIMCSCDVEK